MKPIVVFINEKDFNQLMMENSEKSLGVVSEEEDEDEEDEFEYTFKPIGMKDHKK